MRSVRVRGSPSDSPALGARSAAQSFTGLDRCSSGEASPRQSPVVSQKTSRGAFRALLPSLSPLSPSPSVQCRPSVPHRLPVPRFHCTL